MIWNDFIKYDSFRDRKPENLEIRIKSNYYSSGGFVTGVIYVAVHHRYNEKTKEYDCAVLKTDKNFNQSLPYQVR